MNDEAFEAAYTYAHPRGWKGSEPTREQMRPFLAWYLEAAHPWRPLAQAPRDGRTVELRVPGQSGRQFARVYETDGVTHVSRMLECHVGFGKVSSGPTFEQLCADGAEVREMLP
jgi:hypothetical protein